MNGKFTEHAVLLGGRKSLVGIVTRPVSSARTNGPVIVILNTGIVHRVGHHRMYVTLSRVLASAGRTVLRFDFSGVGDSEQRSDRLSPLDSCLADVKEALDSLEKDYQASRFVLLGLCSGADHAVLYGHTDTRVVGLVLMDPTMPPTARYYFHYVAQRLRNLHNWASVATGRSGLLRLLMAQLLHRMRPRHQAHELTLDTLQFSPYLAQCYRASVSHGVQILAAFTSISARHTYRRQMLDAFPGVEFNDQLKLEFFPDSDHLFSTERDQSQLRQIIGNWFTSTWRSEREPLICRETPGGIDGFSGPSSFCLARLRCAIFRPAAGGE